MASTSTSVWEKASSPALTLMPDNSVPLHMFMVPLELLPQCWSSEEVSLSESVWGPFKRNSLGFQKPWISLSLWFSQPKVMGLLFVSVDPWAWGAWCGAGKLHSSRGTSAAKISLPIFVCFVLVWNQPIPCLYLSYQSQCGFFISLVVGLLFTYISGGYG